LSEYLNNLQLFMQLQSAKAQLRKYSELSDYSYYSELSDYSYYSEYLISSFD